MNKAVMVVATNRRRLDAYSDALAPIVDRVYRVGTPDLAKETLLQAAIDVLVTEVRLPESHGLHLVLWARVHRPEVRAVLVGGADMVLESDARMINASYVRIDDLNGMVDATLEALARGQPRRRWRRRTPRAEVPIQFGGHPGRIVDLSYGGFQFEASQLPERVAPHRLPVVIDRFGTALEAMCCWARPSGGPNPYLCGAELSAEHTSAGSAWRTLVDTLSIPPPAPA